jgi:hypothetical protein
MSYGITNADLKALARRARLESAGLELARTLLDLKPGEVLEVKRNADDAPALLTIARYSVDDEVGHD